MPFVSSPVVGAFEPFGTGGGNIKSECLCASREPIGPTDIALLKGFLAPVEVEPIDDMDFILLELSCPSSLALPLPFPGAVSGKTLAALRPLNKFLILESRSSSLSLPSCPIAPGAALFARLKPRLVFGLDGAGTDNFSNARDKFDNVELGGGWEARLRSNVGSLPAAGSILVGCFTGEAGFDFA